jgi:hypothetical protein
MTSTVDDVLADVRAGVDVINVSRAALRLQYDGRFAENTHQNGVGLKGSLPFDRSRAVDEQPLKASVGSAD